MVKLQVMLVETPGRSVDAMQYISTYDSDWPHRFERIAAALRPHLPEGWDIHHVGSTAVPGTPAKDIIDITIECPPGKLTQAIQALSVAGYEHEGDLGIAAREAFRPRPASRPSHLPPHHLYACESDSPELFKQLAFRDYLAAHARRLDWLAHQKELADRNARSRAQYIQNKETAYAVITHESTTWARRRVG